MSGTTDTASFGVDLKVEGVGSVAAGAQELEGLQKNLGEATDKLAGMQRALRNLKGGGAAAESQVSTLKQAIKAQQATIAQTQARVIQLGGTYKRVQPEALRLEGALRALQSRAGAASGPFGSLIERMRASAGFAKAAPYIALAAAILLVATAAVSATAAMSRFALASADAYRNERLQLEGLVRVRNWYGLAADKASFLQSQIDKVSASSALGRDAVAGQAQELYRMGLRGGNLQSALEGVTLAIQTQGEVGKAQFLGMALSAGRFGGSIKKVTEDFKARLGPIAKAQMLSLGVQAMKLRENLSALFRDVKIEGFLSALNSVTELFSQNTVTGRALKVLVESLFSSLFGQTSVLGPLVKRFFQGMVLGALHLAIAIIRLRNWFRDTFKDSTVINSLTAQKGAFRAGEYAVKAFGFVVLGTVAASVAALGLLGTAVAVALAPVALLASAFYAGYRAIKLFWQGAKAVYNFEWSQFGDFVWQGIVRGLNRGVNAVKKAITGLGQAMKDALRRAIDSHSPSRDFQKISLTAPQGSVVAVKQGTPMVERAFSGLGETAKLSFKASLAGFDQAPRVRKPAAPPIVAAATAKPPEQRPIFGGTDRNGQSLAIEPARAPLQQAPKARAEKPSINLSVGDVYVNGSNAREQADDFKNQLMRVLSEIGTSYGITESG